MKIDVQVYVHLQDPRLDRVISMLQQVLRKEDQMAGELDTLKQQVQRTTEVEQSALTLIQGLAQQIKDNAGDPQALTDLANQLSSEADALAAAVTSNTPSA